MSYTVDDTVWFNGLAYPDVGYAISHTPMKEDIAAIQWLYGAQETNEGDTVYGSDYFDPATPFVMAIWDSGGIDTIDLSAFTDGCDLSLVAGTSSTVVCQTGGAGWLNGQMLDNLSIASGAVIENIIAGSGDDTIVGNAADNVITGGAGADIFEFNAGFGSDTITDFVVGTDKLKIKDTGGNVLTATNLTHSNSGADLLITLGSDDITLEGLGGVTFDNTFLEIV
jgi:serralysin